MNDDLISRQAAIDEVVAWLKDRMTDGKNGKPLTDRIKDLPSAQPEIIRCGDCKYFKVEHGWNCSSYPICEVSPQRIITPDDYCSFAERRTDARQT